MTTAISLTRKLRNRVPDLKFLDIQTVGPFRFRVQLATSGARPFDEVKDDVSEVLKREAMASSRFDIREVSPVFVSSDATVPLEYSLAAFSSDQSEVGLLRTLISVVHDLASVRVEKLDRVVTFYVGREDGAAPHEFLARVRLALETIGGAGTHFEVAAINEVGARHSDLPRLGIPVPSRKGRVVEYTDEDEYLYAKRIHDLVEGRADSVPLVDDQTLNKLYLTSSPVELDLGAILPLYDRVYVDLPPSRDAENYFESIFRLGRESFVQLCRERLIVPIFRHNLGLYPEEIWRSWLEDPSLSFVSPRDADFLAIRHLWDSSPFLRPFRED